MRRKHFTNLFNKYTSGKSSPEERESFFQFLKENPDNRVLSSLMDNLYEDIKTKSGSDVVQMDKKDGKNKNVRWIFLRAIAAVFILGVIVETAIYFTSEQKTTITKNNEKVVQTAKAQKDYLLLPDSTQIWLKASSNVRYPKVFSKEKREIYLEGEAFVDVKHAEDIPFIIHLPNKISITVLGTAFNVKAFPDRRDAIISVARGKVKVEKEEQVLSTLNVGQEIRIKLDSNIAQLKKVKKEQIKSWETGNLYFNDLTMQEVVQDIALQYNVEIKIENEKIGNTIISTGFKKNADIKEIMDVFKTMTDCNIKEENGIYTIY